MLKNRNIPLKLAVIGIIFSTFTDTFSSGALSLGAFDMQGNLSATNDEFVWLNILYLCLKLIAFMITPTILERIEPIKALKIAIVIVVVACLFSTLTTNLHAQYLLRAIQGFSGGILLVSAQSFLFQEFEHKVQPFIQALYAIGAVVIPATFLAGFNGFLIDTYSWEIIYLITIPLGLLSLIFLSFYEKSSFTPTKRRKIDFIGLTLFTLFIFPTIYIIYQGNRYNWFNDRHIAILTLLSITTLVLFILWQIFKKDSLIEIKIFSNNNFSFGVVVSLVAGAALFGSGSIYSSFSIKVLGLTLTESGLILFYSGFMFLITIFITAFVVQVLKLPPFATIGFGLLGFSFSMYFLSLSNFQSDINSLLNPMLLRGASMGFLFLSLTLIAINSLPKDLTAYGIGLFNTTRQLGGSISIGVLGTLITQDNAQNYTILSQYIVENSLNVTNWIDLYTNKLSVDMLDTNTSMVLISKALKQQVMTISYSNAFLYLVCLILLALPFVLRVKKLIAKLNPQK